ncbi:quinol:cytochrome c oxidoreductase quinone-binding subunit 2 [Paucimonas lemoignei]|uniref:Quinol:cytochrome c oxidoreductase quinone-binding subunit 2 n=1 Tax=Paucimonas lemoignei TaxID=29443 RepID=A0A4R3I0W2_PAULE|nr:hypothetical protein [Paucimonas lemoignei]TCS39366.1 quinol:cytochrome c oxidoreductase quinone-binding subunit 2 [Paucimonas lemoignei]
MSFRLPRSAAVLVLVLLAVAAATWLRPGMMLGAYLTVWWLWMGVMLGALANVWLHNLTGGAWGEAIRQPLLHLSSKVWIAALLFLPVLLGTYELYPWAAHAGEPSGWAGELSAPAFKRTWLTPTFFYGRSIAYLAVWSGLAYLSRRAGLARSKPFSALALLAYGLTSGLAAVDWVMSLMPLWYSSVFGWLVNAGQMLGGMAFGVAVVTRSRTPPSVNVSRDLGNLLLMYIMLWAYLAFSEFLIIWAENLPHEIAWYVARRDLPWLAVAWALALGMFLIPLLLLLSRALKQTPVVLGWIASALLFMQFINTCWLVLPSLPMAAIHWLWALPLTAAPFAVLAAASWRARKLPAHDNRAGLHHA